MRKKRRSKQMQAVQREAEVLRARPEELLGASNAREGEGLEVEQEEGTLPAGSPVTLPLDVSTQEFLSTSSMVEVGGTKVGKG